MSNQEFVRVLGAGASGRVTLTYDGRYLHAVKRLVSADDPSTEKRAIFKRECDALSQCESMSIVKMFSYSDDDPLELDLEFVPGGSLGRWVEQKNVGKYLTPTRRHIIFYGVALAIKEVHDHDIVHRDIKPDNVILTDKFEPKLCDFGFARVLDDELRSYVGTEFYVAPEVLNGDCYTKEVDLFSFGRLMYTVLTGDKAGGTAPIPDGPYKDMVEKLTKENPHERMSIEEVVQTLEKAGEFEGVDPDAFADYKRRYEANDWDGWCTPGFLEHAVNEGDNPAVTYILGVLYQVGVGFDKNAEMAERLFLQAGDEGNIAAAEFCARVSKLDFDHLRQRWTRVFSPSQLEYIRPI